MASLSSEIRLTSRQQKSLLQFRDNIAKARQERGREILRGNGVLSLKENEPPHVGTREFLVVVRGARRFEVFVELAGEKAGADCDCEDGPLCQHCYAAVQSLLLRAVIDNQSGERSGRELIAALETAHERKLSAFEMDYVFRLEEAHSNILGKRDITVWDLRGLLPAQFGSGGNRVELWPQPPANLQEFWQYLAHAIVAKGLEFPPFMQPVTDFTLIEGQVRDWLRQREIEEWQHRFADLAATDAPMRLQTMDLRLRFEVEKFILESQGDGVGEFGALKTGRLRSLRKDIEEGRLLLTEPARLLWQYFNPLLEAGSDFTYQEAEAMKALDDLLRMTFLRGSLAAIDGTPLEFAAEPLRWQLTEAEGRPGDYEMQLLTASGTPPLRVLARFAGRPALYLTARTLYPGPQVTSDLSTSERIRIPGEVVQSAVGIRALLSLDTPLPPEINARVRRIPLHLRMIGDLKKVSNSQVEFLHLEVRATDAEDRDFSRFAAEEWMPLPKAPALNADPQFVEILDHAGLNGVERLLETLPVSYDPTLNVWTCKVTRRFSEQFSAWLLDLPESVDLELDQLLSSFRERPLTAKFELEIQEVGVDWFDLRSALKIEDTNLTREEISLLLKAGGEYVRLGAKGWRKLAFEISPEDDEALARLGLSAADLNGEPQRMHVLQLAGGKSRRLLRADIAERIEKRAAELKVSVTPAVPAAIQATLRPYQVEGYHFLAYLSENHFGGILADDMGLGKTLQTLTWLAWLREKPGNANRPSLVVCPKSVTDNWVSESARFYHGLRVGLWREKKAELFPAFVRSHDIVVLNYSQLRSCEALLQAVNWLTIILDEGQFIKNPSSQTTQAAHTLRGDHRLILTGTPIENRLLDLWSLMSFAMPVVLGKQTKFQTHFNEKKDSLATRRLAARVRPFLLRRSKKEVATDLPDRIEEDLICEMEGSQLTRYRAELKLARQRLLKIQTGKQLDKERFNILTSLLRLRQICAHPALVDPKLSDEVSAKEEALFDLLEPLIEEGHKVLVFSQFVTMLGRLQKGIAEREWKSFYLAGETEDRGPLVQEFQTHPGSAVFLISLRAGGFGLNLTSASYVVLYDPWWNPAVENQAIDRTHRIGQVNKVMAYRLIIKDSIEEKIRSLQKSKGALAEDILGEENFVRTLTLDDFNFLFAGE